MVRRQSVSALVRALFIEDETEVKRLLLNVRDLNRADSDGWTPLMVAAARGTPKFVRAIVDGGADVNKGNSDGFTPLMSAAGGGHTQIVRFLVQRGAAVDFADIYGRTALSWAVTKGDFDKTAKLLVELGADVSRPDSEGFTPLMRSALASHPRCFETLIVFGAEIDVVHPALRKTAMEMAVERGSDALKDVVMRIRGSRDG